VTEHGRFIRVLGRRDTIALAFGAIIGWSWVLLTGTWIATAGWLGAIAAFVAGGIAMLFISLTYAELASAMPQAGGEHVYSLRALGHSGSFVCTWALILAYVTVVVFEAVALPTGLAWIFPEIEFMRLWAVAGEDVNLGFALTGCVGAAVMTYINYIGVRPAAIVQTVVTAMILIAGFMLATGLTIGDGPGLPDVGISAGLPGILSVLIMVPMMFIGFDVIPQTAEEIDLPFEQIGRLIVVSVLLALGWYLLMIVSVALSLTPEEMSVSEMPTADANASNWGRDWAGVLMVTGGIAGILTSWNAFLVGASRAVYALAHSGLLPAWLGHLHPRFNTPHKAILAIGALSIAAPFAGRRILLWMINAGGFAVVLAFALVAWSFIVLRKEEPEMERPCRTGQGPWVGYVALALSAALFCVYLPWSPAALEWPYEWLICVGWALIGIVFYLRAPVRHSAG
jgi:amino acid transporter